MHCGVRVIRRRGKIERIGIDDRSLIHGRVRHVAEYFLFERAGQTAKERADRLAARVAELERQARGR